MRFKTLSSLAITLLALLFIACDDDLGSLGSSIQPDGDKIQVGTDTIIIKAQTVSFEDSIYARTIYGVLGEYDDPLFGKVKSDFLCEFFSSEGTHFLSHNAIVDSVQLALNFNSYTGDAISPMGISVYEVTESLKPFYFTSIDPAKYTDNMKTLYGQSIFTIQDTPDTTYTYSDYTTATYKRIAIDLNKSIGENLYDKWLADTTAFSNSDKLHDVFKGVYVTTTFGSGSLINVDYTEFNVYYSYPIRNHDNTSDSTVVGVLRMPVTPEVIQMNRVKNSIPQSLFDDANPTDPNKKAKTYMKTPAGLYTQITIPLEEIKDRINKEGKDMVMNSVNIRIKGLTEEEEEHNYIRPTYILIINKDSLENFFFNKKLPDYKTSFIVSRNTTSSSSSDVFNSYDFGNISSIINYYTDYYKGEVTLPNLEYLLIPVNATYDSSTSSLTNVYNIMEPSTAILRTDPDNMKMSLIYSKYNNNRGE